MERHASVYGVSPAVFLVAHDRVAFFREMDAYLVFSPRCQIDIQKTEPFCLFDGPVDRRGKFSDRPVVGGINNVRGIFGQIGRNRSGPLREAAVNDGKIFFFGLVPLMLKGVFRPFVFREDDDPRCVPVKAMDDEDTIA